MIYVIGQQRTGIVKIGVAANPAKRLREIQAGNHEPLQLLVVLPGEREAEQALHEVFAQRCVGGEWFDFGEDDAVLAVVLAVTAPPPSARRHALAARRITKTPAAGAVRDADLCPRHPDVGFADGCAECITERDHRRARQASMLR